MGKLYLRMDSEVQVCFMFNADLVGNRQGLHHGKRNTFYFFGLFLGTGGVVFSKGMGVFLFYFT